MPDPKPAIVELTIDTDRFVAAMRKLSAAVAEFERMLGPRHHRREIPTRSAMHAAYDQRRRARRRRRRR